MGDKKAGVHEGGVQGGRRSPGAGPEAFVVVAVMDEQDPHPWGGEDTPCALCNLASLGSINKANNTRLSGAITALMSSSTSVPIVRLYTNFWDIGQPRELRLQRRHLCRGSEEA